MEQTGNQVVAEMAAQREAAATAPYTIERAISDAQWVARTPDGFLHPDKAKACITTLLAAIERSTCFRNATLRGQEVFVLVQQDRAAPAAITKWADEADKHGATEKATDAYRTAARWQDQPPTSTKWPT